MQLLKRQAERAVLAGVEEVAALRRSLPPGGIVPDDYVFAESPADLAADGSTREARHSVGADPDRWLM